MVKLSAELTAIIPLIIIRYRQVGTVFLRIKIIQYRDLSHH